MNKCLLLLIFFPFMGSAQFIDDNSPNEQKITSTLSSPPVTKSRKRKIFPVWPKNFHKISQGNISALCNRFIQGEDSGGYKGLINDIRLYYGDPREFFYKYGMSLPCKSPSVSLADYLLEKSFLNIAFSNIFMKFGGLDPNTFVIIKREGLYFEGPLHVVYKHLYDNFKDSKHFSEYRGVYKRLGVKKFVNGTPKSCEELRIQEPKMPCILPLPKISRAISN